MFVRKFSRKVIVLIWPFLLMVALFAPTARAWQKANGIGTNAPPPDETQQTSPSDTSAKTGSNAPPEETQSADGPESYLTKFERQLSLQILIFGVIVLILEYLALRHERTTAEETLRIYAVTLIIIGTLFALAAGWDSTQIAPAMGLFGTIAGYLLGRRAPASTNAPAEGEKK